jgi:hypothetical protein
MLSTRDLLASIQTYMPAEPQLDVLKHLNRAYLRLAQNDIGDFVYLICNDEFPELQFTYPVLKRTYFDGGDNFVQKSCVEIDAGNFQDEDGNPLFLVENNSSFMYHNQEVTCRKVNAFFVERRDDRRFLPANQQPFTPFNPFINNRYSSNKIIGPTDRILERFPATLKPPDGEFSAQAIFTGPPYEGPVNTTDPGDIYIEFWFTPPSLTNPRSKMLLDVSKWQDELTNGAVGYYEDKVNGSSERLEKFLRFDRKQFMNEGNSNLHNRGNQQFLIREIG